jgi:hypothetical protein
MTLGPVLVALAIAFAKLAWWQTLDALLLVSLAAVAPRILSKDIAAKAHIGWISLTLASLAPGLVHALAWDRPSQGNALSQTELQVLILRDLAGWISHHSDPAATIVLSPPSESAALCYYGAFRGLGSLSDENDDGAKAAALIMGSRSVREAKEIVNRRNITHIVLLSWDTFFEDYLRAVTGQVEGTLYDRLKFTTLPLWLRPLAYRLPSVPGFENQSVTVLEVVEEQDEATALGNIALYFVETGDLDQARAAAKGLTRFPIDFGSWVVRAQVAAATRDRAESAKILKVIQARLAARVQPLISWSRRVDLAVVLARANDETLAKKELKLCIDDIDDAKIRSLSPGSLFRLLVLTRAFGLSFDPQLHRMALELIPAELRSRLQ